MSDKIIEKMSKKFQVYVICQNFSNCKQIIDVTGGKDLLPSTINKLHERKLCPECSRKKMEQKRAENPTLFKGRN